MSFAVCASDVAALYAVFGHVNSQDDAEGLCSRGRGPAGACSDA